MIRFVMAGLVPAIHAFLVWPPLLQDVDARDKPGHDELYDDPRSDAEHLAGP
jgi:hypothetical protein